MRLRGIESAKRAAPATTASSSTATTSASTAPASAGPATSRPAKTAAAKSTRPRHPVHSSKQRTLYIARRSAIPLCLRHRILYALPDIVFAEVGHPVGHAHLPAHRYRISSRQIVATANRCQRRLCAKVSSALARIREIVFARQAQRLRSTSLRSTARACNRLIPSLPCALSCARSRARPWPGAVRPLRRWLLLHARRQLHHEVRRLIRLSAARAQCVDLHLLRITRKRRQLRLHRIYAIIRYRHRESAIHIRCRRILLAGLRIRRRHRDTR